MMKFTGGGKIMDKDIKDFFFTSIFVIVGTVNAFLNIIRIIIRIQQMIGI